ncbi:MAG: hypothetical protein V2I57_00590 [Xanthomonadales bacterium]|jgi:hypothetical protein|nr:hypothetical protein [Xanthomonadales bacterium]
MKREFFEHTRQALAEERGKTRPGVGSLIFSYVLGYLRWTQFIPMVVGWGGVLFLLGALAFGRFAVGFEELAPETQADFWSSPFVRQGVEWADRGVGFLGERYRTPAGEFDPGPFVREAWSLLALLGFLLGQLLGAFGLRPPPRTLGQKIKMTGIVSLSVAFAATVLLLSFGELLHAGKLDAVFWSLLLVAFPFLFSCWGLWVSDRIAVIEELFGFRDPPPSPPEGGG